MKRKDFGPYAMPDGRMPVCFATATDNTGPHDQLSIVLS